MPKSTNRITIVDSIMGSGKSYRIIKKLQTAYSDVFPDIVPRGEDTGDRFIVITPYKAEAERFQRDAPQAGIQVPADDDGPKVASLKHYIENNQNIACTHELFKRCPDHVQKLIADRKYHLIIDEALSSFDLFDELDPDDVKIVFNMDMVYADERLKLRWNHKDHGSYQGRKFINIKRLCDSGNLVVYQPEGGGRRVFFWELSSEILNCFESVELSTYLFKGSPLEQFLKYEGFEFDVKAIRNGELIDHAEADETAIKSALKPLITVYEGNGNKIGRQLDPKGKRPFSMSWLKNTDKKTSNAVRSATSNFFRNVCKTTSALNMWTTGKEHKRKFGAPGYAKGWVANNARATNDLNHKKSLAFLYNVFLNPVTERFFEKRELVMDEEAVALSTLVQWIWRSQIREGKPINIFIPSERMRALFLNWLSNTPNTKELK